MLFISIKTKPSLPTMVWHRCQSTLYSGTHIVQAAWPARITIDFMYLKHEANFAHCVLKDTRLFYGPQKKFIIFSDNCCAQYKSRLQLYLVKELSKTFNIEIFFFGERHDKSECDSVGGIVKTFLSWSVATGRVALTDLKRHSLTFRVSFKSRLQIAFSLIPVEISILSSVAALTD